MQQKLKLLHHIHLLMFVVSNWFTVFLHGRNHMQNSTTTLNKNVLAAFRTGDRKTFLIECEAVFLGEVLERSLLSETKMHFVKVVYLYEIFELTQIAKIKLPMKIMVSDPFSVVILLPWSNSSSSHSSVSVAASWLPIMWTLGSNTEMHYSDHTTRSDSSMVNLARCDIIRGGIKVRIVSTWIVWFHSSVEDGASCWANPRGRCYSFVIVCHNCFVSNKY